MSTAPPSEGMRLGDQQHRRAPAEGAGESLMVNTAPTAKSVTVVLVPALVLMLAFAFFYVGAFHEPTPHHVPVAVVGPPPVAVALSRLPGDPLDARLASSRADALSQIDDRKVYGAYEAATNRATAIALEQTFKTLRCRWVERTQRSSRRGRRACTGARRASGCRPARVPEPRCDWRARSGVGRRTPRGWWGRRGL